MGCLYGTPVSRGSRYCSCVVPWPETQGPFPPAEAAQRFTERPSTDDVNEGGISSKNENRCSGGEGRALLLSQKQNAFLQQGELERGRSGVGVRCNRGRARLRPHQHVECVERYKHGFDVLCAQPHQIGPAICTDSAAPIWPECGGLRVAGTETIYSTPT